MSSERGDSGLYSAHREGETMRLVDIEVPNASTLIVLLRADGSATVSVEASAVEKAIDLYHSSNPIAWPPKELLHEPAVIYEGTP